MSWRSMAGMASGLPTSASSQSSSATYTWSSVPRNARREPPEGIAASASGSGSVSLSRPYPVTATPTSMSVTCVAGPAQLPIGRWHAPELPAPPVPALVPAAPLEFPPVSPAPAPAFIPPLLDDLPPLGSEPPLAFVPPLPATPPLELGAPLLPLLAAPAFPL